MKGTNKVALLGGGGLRTPLLIHGLAEARAAIGVRELALYDIEPRRATMMAKLGEEIDAGAIGSPETGGAEFPIANIAREQGSTQIIGGLL